MKERSLIQLVLISLRGVAMGAADVVPRVSGGTIAFITGIYQELIESLNALNLKSLKILFNEGVKPFWKYINGTFLLFLFGGILISIVSLAKIVLHLLENYPILLWSFFFGLIIASIWLIGKTISKWSMSVVVFLLFGAAVAFEISKIDTVASVDSHWYILLSGAIAICAMILPGISGSFILVLLGSYHPVLTALKEKDFLVLGLFFTGCIIGLMSFARLLKILFKKYKEITIALLMGFMIGSLSKVWPWKLPIGDAPLIIHSDGREDWMMSNTFPGGFDSDPQVWTAVFCALSGVAIIILLDRFAPKQRT